MRTYRSLRHYLRNRPGAGIAFGGKRAAIKPEAACQCGLYIEAAPQPEPLPIGAAKLSFLNGAHGTTVDLLIVSVTQLGQNSNRNGNEHDVGG